MTQKEKAGPGEETGTFQNTQPDTSTKSIHKSEPGASQREDNPIKRHYAKPTRKTAVNAMCAYCMGCTATEQGNGQIDHLVPGFRIEIRDCSASCCPLYAFRPYQPTNETE